jgi:hypothetical protein
MNFPESIRVCSTPLHFNNARQIASVLVVRDGCH